MKENNCEFDVVILGGGLAGLGLAKQIIERTPATRILIIEKACFPRPIATAKVGESTVEIGSHYLAKRLGLESHLEEKHLRKFGIRLFFGPPEEEFSQHDELGASQVFGIPTYQIDRGVLENHLWQKVCDRGVRVEHGASVASLTATGEKHQVNFVDAHGAAHTATCRWIVDAAGRASLLKNHLNLRLPSPHKASAVWFRVDKTVKLDQWSDNSDWHALCSPQERRWLSTNHLMGPGYWVWIIPLATDITSFGIVMDDLAMADSGIHSAETAMQWLNKRHPHCAAAIGDARFLDFVKLEHYSYDCRQLFSADGWAITGEAGRFADPLYSPGSDFIAFSNDFICDLICSQQAGEDIRLKAMLYDKVLRSIYENTLSLYLDQYGGFGDRVMMGAKLLWDYSYYWGVLSLLYFADSLASIETLKQCSPLLQQAQALNQDVQSQFRKRAEKRIEKTNTHQFMNQYAVPCLQQFNQALHSPNQDNLAETLENNLEMLHDIASIVTDLVSETPSEQISEQEEKLIGQYRKQVLPELFY